MTTDSRRENAGAIFEGRATCPPFLRGALLLTLLQAGGGFTGQELAERLGVNERTLRRYIKDLCALGFEVDSQPGHYGGYYLQSVPATPPIQFQDDEIETILAGLAMLRHPDDEYSERAKNLDIRMQHLLPKSLVNSLSRKLMRKIGEGYQLRQASKS